MLPAFLAANRGVIMASMQARMTHRAPIPVSRDTLQIGITRFLDRLGQALLAHDDDVPGRAALNQTATEHGRTSMGMGLTIAEVVRDYGDVCQVITELAAAQGETIEAGEFQVLNRCVDDAVAAAVTEFAGLRESSLRDESTERLGSLAHELRNVLNGSMLSFDMIKRGRVLPSGKTAVAHERSLLRLRDLIERTLADVRLDAGIDRHESITVVSLLEEVSFVPTLQARSRGLSFSVGPVDAAVTVSGDRQVLLAALANLLQNAVKFTPQGGNVTLSARVDVDTVGLDVADQCGGLPGGSVERMFQPFDQRSSDRSGLGLGLTICRKAARASGGTLNVRDRPGIGCVFTLELPRSHQQLLPAAAP